uniref:Uncharacterized protein n=1 Tax=Amicula sp. isolate GU52X-4 cfCalB7 TaxID=3003489 RepID=A0A9E8Z2W8_9STRA|nr:hypothetical protein [Amicula sp. isolate GU52X-4 cfCalB7]
MDFNFKIDAYEYGKLLEKENELGNQGKSLRQENFKEYRKLIIYDQIFLGELIYDPKYKYMYQYNSLIQKYLNNFINESEFIKNFSQLFSNNRETMAMVKWAILEEGVRRPDRFPVIPSQARLFVILLEEIEKITESSKPSSSLTSVEFRSSIKEIYAKMQNLLKEE